MLAQHEARETTWRVGFRRQEGPVPEDSGQRHGPEERVPCPLDFPLKPTQAPNVNAEGSQGTRRVTGGPEHPRVRQRKRLWKMTPGVLFSHR